MNYFNYFTEIEDTFVRRRGKHLFLSPIDWAMMEGWQERGVPLHVVIRAIETVFDGFDKNPGPRSIKGLMYCREEVEAQFEEWQRSQIGSTETDHDSATALNTDEIRAAVIAAAETLERPREDPRADDFERAAARLREVADTLGSEPEAIDASLSSIEKFLDEVLLTKTGSQHLKQAERAVNDELKPYKKAMDAEAFNSTFRLMVLKRLREDAGIPRLGLFYL